MRLALDMGGGNGDGEKGMNLSYYQVESPQLGVWLYVGRR